MKTLTTILEVNSKDRSSGSNTNYCYNLKDFSVSNVQSIKINRVNIPYSFYSLKNQNITLNLASGGSGVINFIGGNYNVNQLCAYLENEINTIIAPATSTCTYNFPTNIISINFVGENVQFVFDNTVGPQYRLSYAIGMLEYNTGNIFPPVAPIFFVGGALPFQLHLSANPNVYISSNKLRVFNTSYLNARQSNIIQSVPVIVNSFNYIAYSNNYEITFDNTGLTIDSFDIQLKGEEGDIIDLDFNSNWSFELEFKHLYY